MPGYSWCTLAAPVFSAEMIDQFISGISDPVIDQALCDIIKNDIESDRTRIAYRQFMNSVRKEDCTNDRRSGEIL